MLGRGGWGILGTVSGDVGSKRVIFRGSWGYVVTFWCRPVPETLPGCTLAGSWVAGWGAWGPRGSPGREGTLRRCPPGLLGGLGAVARRNFKDFISWDFKALKLKVLRLEGLKD